jgi:hypothetical protein
LAILACCAIAEPALAAFGPVARISNTGKRPNRGDVLTVESDWLDAPGYRPVRFQLDCVPSTADRTLTIEFYAQHWYGPALTVALDLEVPAGSAQAVKEVSIPQYYPWQMFQVTVSEDGRQNEELSGFSGGTSSFTGQWQSQWPSTLMIGEWPSNVDLSPFANMAGVAGAYSQNPNSATPNTTAAPKNFTTGNLHALPASALPKKWIDYTGLDIICLSLDELEKLKTANPEAWTAVRNWTAAGGNLWVHGVEHASKQTRVEELLEMPAAWKDAKTSAAENAWRPTAGNPSHGIEPGAFAMRDFQRGRIVGIKKEILQLVQSGGFWQGVRDELGMDRYLWHRRFGTTLEHDNFEFWNFLIPGVGLAPVNAYRLLITFFVIAIGPINYGLLYRYRRLHLLMFTVPASAVVVAAGLIGYALAADGVETRVRGRTFTEIDQRRGEAISAGRLSYYAALAPSGGLEFPLDTAVFPMEASRNRYYGHNRGERRYLSLVDQQHMSSGWMNSRTHTQYVVARLSPTEMKLDISTTAGVIHVHNQLGTDILHLLLFDENGNRHYGASIAVDAQADLQRLAAGQAANDQPPFDVMSQAYLTALPRDNRPNSAYYVAQQPYVITPGMQDSPDRVTTASSRLEAGLQDHLQNPGQRVRPRSYVAIVSRNPHVPLGIESPSETGSFHVIVGYW